jgi:ribosomal protein S18 acetylase RimI-like enzyme
MISIVEAKQTDFNLISELGRKTFIESHGSSATQEDIDYYIKDKYNPKVVQEELMDLNNIYHLLYYNNQLAGYSKIIINAPHPNIKVENVAKLERLYLLKEFYDLKLGHELFKFNVDFSKEKKQNGMWLFVWTENHRAIKFYLKIGFIMIGEHNFKISETHSNPNHQMLLVY